MKLPHLWRLVRIPDVCVINPRLELNDKPQHDDLVSFVPMSAVDENFGEITKPEIRAYNEVSKGFTPFKNGDVLFAKITPSMENGKAAIARNLENGIGFGSTEFHVFRPCKLLMADYLFFFIRQQIFRKWAKYSFVGSAGQQRVPIDFFNRVPFPLPPIIEQQRIVVILQHVERLHFFKNECMRQENKIRFKLFNDFFGELNKKLSRWKYIKVGQVSKISYGLPEKLDHNLTDKDGYRIL